MLVEVRIKKMILTGTDPKDKKIFDKRVKKNLDQGWEEFGHGEFRKTVTIREADSRKEKK